MKHCRPGGKFRGQHVVWCFWARSSFPASCHLAQTIHYNSSKCRLKKAWPWLVFLFLLPAFSSLQDSGMNLCHCDTRKEWDLSTEKAHLGRPALTLTVHQENCSEQGPWPWPQAKGQALLVSAWTLLMSFRNQSALMATKQTMLWPIVPGNKASTSFWGLEAKEGQVFIKSQFLLASLHSELASEWEKETSSSDQPCGFFL